MKANETKHIRKTVQRSKLTFNFLNFKFLSTFFLIIAALFMQSCKQGNEQVAKSPVKKPPLVKVQPAIKTKLVSFIELTGTIQANIFTDIKAPADGIIEALMARENQWVKKDKIIAVINPSDRLALISNNQLQLQEIESKLKTTEQNSEQYNLLLTDLEQAKEQLDFATKMYQTIPVICPLSGLVTQRWLDKGNEVLAKDKILTISDMSSLVIKAEVNEKYFEAIRQGLKLSVILNAYPKDTLTGSISLVYPQVDPNTRSVKFDIKIANFSKTLFPGMMASIKIPISTKENAIAIPEQALLTSPDSKHFIFVLDKDSIARRKIVEKGIVSGNKLEIIKGVNEGDKVVVYGQEMLKDSLKVKILK